MAEARLTGPADPSEEVSVSIRLRRRADAPPFPDVAEGVVAKTQRRLTHEEFAATYGAHPDDISHIVSFAHEFGLEVVETSIPRRTVVVSGTVEQVSRAFAVELGRYEAGTTSYRGREGHVHVPDDLAPLVEGVFGLDDRQQARALFRPATGPAEEQAPLTPPQVAQLYSFPTGQNAAGQCIGLLEFGGGYVPSDVTTWFTNLHLTPPTLTDVGVDGATNSPGSGADVEVLLDIDVSGSVAQGADIAVYFAPWTEQGWVDVVTTAVHDAVNNPSVLSISWGWPEYETADNLTWTAMAMEAVDATFQEAALLGVSVLAASGDQGSQCQITDGKAHVLFPTSDPFVTSCGGTEIEDVSGESFTEVLWNDNGASGGGVSAFFPVQVWQGLAGVPPSINDPSQRGRGVPDIAGNADPNSGYYLIQNGAQIGPIGGTSAAAPLYAGMVALFNAHLGERSGYLNPLLYWPTPSSDFQDITSAGTNGYGGTRGYPVGVGWDATTGLGRVEGMALLGALEGGLTCAIAAAVVPGTDILQLFYRGQNGGVYSIWRNPDGSWSVEQSLGSSLTSEITAAVVPGTDILQLFYRGQDYGVHSMWRNPDGSWSGDQALGAFVTSEITATVVPGTNILQLFYRGPDYGVHSMWRNPDGSWSADQALGGIISSSITAAVVPAPTSCSSSTAARTAGSIPAGATPMGVGRTSRAWVGS